MKKLPPHTLRYALSLGTSLIMTFLVSGVATFSALGFANGVFSRWLLSWMISWTIAFPTMFFIMPVVRRLLVHVIEEIEER